MSDKDLSKPIGFANKSALEYARYSGCEFEVYASDDVQGYDTPVYSAEYVQSLLGRIESMAQAHIALQQLCEVYRSAYEEVRGISNPLIAEAQEKRIGELELDRDTWQAAALALRDTWREETHHNGMMQLSNELAKANARIAELEAIVTTPVKLPLRVDMSNVPFTAYTWNCCLDAVAERIKAHGLTVQED
ncbi:MAG: hypothetical protein ACRCV4_14300 [Hafnia alvei]